MSKRRKRPAREFKEPCVVGANYDCPSGGFHRERITRTDYSRGPDLPLLQHVRLNEPAHDGQKPTREIVTTWCYSYGRVQPDFLPFFHSYSRLAYVVFPDGVEVHDAAAAYKAKGFDGLRELGFPVLPSSFDPDDLDQDVPDDIRVTVQPAPGAERVSRYQ
jgi:hypothetical protein